MPDLTEFCIETAIQWLQTAADECEKHYGAGCPAKLELLAALGFAETARKIDRKRKDARLASGN